MEIVTRRRGVNEEGDLVAPPRQALHILNPTVRRADRKRRRSIHKEGPALLLVALGGRQARTDDDHGGRSHEEDEALGPHGVR